MKILLVGSGEGDHFWALHVNRYTAALKEMGHEVTSLPFHQLHRGGLIPHEYAYDNYDLLILQDTHLEGRYAMALKGAVGGKYAQFTHSEGLHSEKDTRYIRMMQPDHIFTDQPVGVTLYEPLSIPVTWMGHGADLVCKPNASKHIDILWVGNRYDERETIVQREVAPLMNSDWSMVMHGAGYSGGLIPPSEMFRLMSMSKVVIHVGHPVTYLGGYAGTRISDALASGCYVVSTKYPGAEERYPVGASFVEGDAIKDTVLEVLDRWEGYYEEWAHDGRLFVLKHRMATNDMELVLREMGYEDS